MTPNYKFKQQALYGMCKILLSQLAADMQYFTDFKSSYTQLHPQLFQQLTNAIAMPSEQQRNATYEMARVKLEAYAGTFFSEFRKLKSYITEAYVMELDSKIQCDAAGDKHYPLAVAKNWLSLQSLINMAESYAISNDVFLQTNGQMPNTFTANISNLAASVRSSYDDYINAQTQAKSGQIGKVTANNGIYDVMRKICKDAQLIFEGNEIKSQIYTITYLLNMVDGGGTQGIKGTIVDDNEQPIDGIIVTILETGDTTLTKNGGKYIFKGLKSGSYTIKYESSDKQTITEDIEVEPHTMSIYNQLIQALPTA